MPRLLAMSYVDHFWGVLVLSRISQALASKGGIFSQILDSYGNNYSYTYAGRFVKPLEKNSILKRVTSQE